MGLTFKNSVVKYSRNEGYLSGNLNLSKVSLQKGVLNFFFHFFVFVQTSRYGELFVPRRRSCWWAAPFYFLKKHTNKTGRRD